MAVTIRDVQLQQKDELDQKEPRASTTRGLLVSVNGSVTVPGRVNYVYFQEYAQPENAPPAVVFNDAVAPIDQLPVIVGTETYPPFKRKVLGIYSDQLIEGDPSEIGQFNLPLHAPTHQYVTETNIGHDPVLIYQPAVQMLKGTGNNGLVVTVQPLIFQYQNRTFWFPGDTIDITTSLPVLGNVRILLIYLDALSNNLAVVEGTEVLDNGSITIPYPDVPANAIPSTYVLLVGGATEVLTAFDFQDARTFLTGYTGTSATLLPRRIGDMLTSNDGLVFEPGEPTVDAWGEVIMDSLGHFVTT